MGRSKKNANIVRMNLDDPSKQSVSQEKASTGPSAVSTKNKDGFQLAYQEPLRSLCQRGVVFSTKSHAKEFAWHQLDVMIFP